MLRSGVFAVLTAVFLILTGAPPSAAQGSDAASEIQLSFELFAAHHESGDFAKAAGHLEHAILLYDAQGLGDPQYRAQLASVLAATYQKAGDVEGTLRAVGAGLSHEQVLSTRFSELYAAQAWAQSELGAFGLAASSYAQAVTYAGIQSEFEPDRYGAEYIAALTVRRAHADLRGRDLIIISEDAVAPLAAAVADYERLSGSRSDASQLMLAQAHLAQANEVRARQILLEIAGRGAPDLAGIALSWMAILEWQAGDRPSAAQTALAALSRGELTSDRAMVMRSIHRLADPENHTAAVVEELLEDFTAAFQSDGSYSQRRFLNVLEVYRLLLDVLPDDALRQEEFAGYAPVLEDLISDLQVVAFGDYFQNRLIITIKLRYARLLEAGDADARRRASDLYQEVWLWTGATLVDTAFAMAGLGRTGIVVEGALRSDLATRARFAENAARAAGGFLETIPSRFESFQSAQVVRLSAVIEQSVDALFDEMTQRNVVSVAPADDPDASLFQTSPYQFAWETPPEAPLAPLVLEGLSGLMLERAYRQIQLARLSVAGRAVEEMAARVGAEDPEMAALLRQRDALIEDRIRTLQIKEEAGVDRFQRLDRIDRALSGIEAELDQKYPAFRDQIAIRPLSLQEARDLIGPEEALVTYFLTDAGMHSFTITKSRVIWHRSAVGAQWLNEAVDDLRKTLDPRGPLRGSVDLGAVTETPEGFDLTLAHEVYEAVLGPVARLLPMDHTLMIVPDGPLQFLPLAALVAEAPGDATAGPERFRRAHWAIRDHAFATLPVTASLRALRKTAQRETAGSFLGFGDPVFRQDASWFRLAPLPETRAELATLNAVISAGSGRVFLGEDANETALSQLDLTDASVIAFATHGLMAGEVSGLSEPALALTPTDAAVTGLTGAGDGLLTASEIGVLELNADWVILSACSTASGNQGEGSEGLSGLARAFFYAGARQLVVSHWAVQSDATVALTTGMFEAMSEPQLSGAQAIRRSMLRMLEMPDRPQWSHPGVWAPFVTVGG